MTQLSNEPNVLRADWLIGTLVHWLISFVEQFFQSIFAHIFVNLVVDHYDRRVVAVTEAGNFFVREFSVGRGFACANVEMRFDRGANFFTAREIAWQIVAHANYFFADRMRVQVRVKIGDAVHFGERHVESARDFDKRCFGKPAARFLRFNQRGQQTRTTDRRPARENIGE